MKVFLRTLAISVFAVAIADTAAAQQAWILNAVDVQQLVATDTPQAHTALAKHFMALAEIYKADATRYTALETGFIGNPNHATGIDVAGRRMRQAAEAARNADTARAVAAYHQILSIGGMATTPAGAIAFHGGKGTPGVTLGDLNRLGQSARRPADHRVLAEYYLYLARNETSSANQSVATAALARVSGGRNTVAVVDYNERLARRAREVARLANAAVQRHRQLANAG